MTAKSRYKRYFLAHGPDARVRSHASRNPPPRPSPSGAMAIVNCSTAWASRSTFMSTRAKSYCASYWVPDCPVVRLRINFQPSGEGMVQRLYLPAGTAVPAGKCSPLTPPTPAAFALVLNRTTRASGPQKDTQCHVDHAAKMLAHRD